MANLTIDGRPIEAPNGAPLVEVLKSNGFYVSNLCYIDGLPPYAGCRTCLVEIEGAPGLQLSCTNTVREGMVVRSSTAQVKQARQYVLSIINANHSDRCLSCHRRVKCMPGDICLRDDVVTHRCLTCSKNYRCELQSTNEQLDMGKDNIEPWEGEERTYYQAEPPAPDRANPWLEFDPQMCIICTRCVRACDDLRHTRAITLAGRGFTTRIAFGSGGEIQESSCDFCGSCIDVCPTATLMEKPNKWLARTEDWVSTVCNACSVGCTISIGHRNGKPVIVKPDTLNPFSDDQICVRGRFHYDAVKPKERLSQHMVRRGAALEPSDYDATLSQAVERLAAVREQHGADAIAFLGSPVATNEENYLVQRIAREVVGTPHIDFSTGPLNRAVARAVAGAFGTEQLPADLVDIPQSARTIVVVADDLEETHNVAALRIKDAVDPRKLPKRAPAKLIVVSSRWGELCDFAEPFGGVWLQPEPGREPAVLAALAKLIAQGDVVATNARDAGLDTAVLGGDAAAQELEGDALERAAQLLGGAAAEPASIAVLYAPKDSGASLAAETAKAAANLALLLCGRNAPRSFYVMPTDANVNGALDAGVQPDAGPGRVPVEQPGHDFNAIIENARNGTIKALVIAGDNPLMFAPGRARVEEALDKLDTLVVIDRLRTDTAAKAHVLFADAPEYAKDGTFTSADRRVQRLRQAQSLPGDAVPAWKTLSDLGRKLAEKFGVQATFSYDEAGDVTNEIARTVPGYERFVAFGFFGWSKQRAVIESAPERLALQQVGVSPRTQRNGEVTLLTGRTLFTSTEASAIHLEDADKLHREDAVFVNQYDALDLGIAMGEDVVLKNGSAELSLRVSLTTRLPRGSVFVSSYYDGGVVTSLLPSENGLAAPARVTLAKKGAAATPAATDPPPARRRRKSSP
ncbi:MAG: molybdopterin-dependent oxidoreductase [Dehalococcoidia bacterium]